jgi:hypothetical protein
MARSLIQNIRRWIIENDWLEAIDPHLQQLTGR